ncbi:hypothetical protein predicted by Glimmer/Critica [Salmonella enterica subsp. enterica serovar Weltevreden str. 2007-60-3289-1]|nr:hypothetical protein predicted by Glimmer/Critica [Salmonella enterica subsp. enterica serovar Weltevreden str. 2007-60-3289-1]
MSHKCNGQCLTKRMAFTYSTAAPKNPSFAGVQV